jgi:hypothetical protein
MWYKDRFVMSQQDQPPTLDNASDTPGDEVTRDQRIAAMRELAGATPAPVINVPSRRKRTYLALIIALVAIVVLVSVGAAWEGLFPWQRQQPVGANSLASINLAADNLFCPSYAVWSPDGARIAVLAQTGACTRAVQGIISPSVVALFDTHGQLVGQFDIDAYIPASITYADDARAAATATGIPQTIQLYPEYLGLLWSRDGKRLAAPYLLNVEENGESNSTEAGVALISVDDSSATGFASWPFYGNNVFDLQAKRLIHRNSSDWQISLAYQWTADGKLVAAPTTSSEAPVGSPSGGQSFTIWQPGTVMLDRKTSALNFGSVVTAWSPDGRYLMPLVGFGGELDPNATGFTQGSDGEYHLAPRDKGLMAAAVRLKDPADPYVTLISVAWRADGKLIAATDPNPLIDQVVANGDTEDIPDASRSISIFDCATGTRLLTLKTRPLANHQSNYAGLVPQPALDWNPTGDKLFFLDTTFDTLTIWNVNRR